jgi:biotin operon repressor
MAKLSKAKEYAILYLNDIMETSEQTIAEELNISVSTVNEVLSNRAVEEPVVVDKKKSKGKVTKAHDMMIRHTAGKKDNGVSIMTKEANEYQQELMKKLNSQKRENKAIFRMR